MPKLETTVAPKQKLSTTEEAKIRNDFYMKYDVDIMRLDDTCIADFPRIMHAKMK
jgi:hypothetical protein